MKASGLLAARFVGGPIGARLSQDQSAGLAGFLTEFCQRGGRLYVENGLFRTLISGGQRQLEPGEALERLRQGGETFLTPPGASEGLAIESLDTLAAADAFHLGGSPLDTNLPHRSNALWNLHRAGYAFPGGLLQAYLNPRDVHVTPPGGSRPTVMSHFALEAEDHYRVSHDRRSLSRPGLADALEELNGLVDSSPADLYGAANSFGYTHLTYNGVRMAWIEGCRPDGAREAVSRARAFRHLLDGSLGDPAHWSVDAHTAEHLGACVVERDAGADPGTLFDGLLDIHARAGTYPSRVADSYRRLVDSGLRGEALVVHLEILSRLLSCGPAQIDLEQAEEGVGFVLNPGQTPFASLDLDSRVRHYAALSKVLGGPGAREILQHVAGVVDQGSLLPQLRLLVYVGSCAALAGKPDPELTALHFVH
ncbi:MAG: hypothetical protein AB1758_20785, partial [Candidatus Eremiobacterota bacterium]